MSKIHILDDTSYILDLLSNLLPNHSVKVFTNPEKFLTAVDSDPPDVIITDLRVSRYDAIKHIRSFKQKNIAVKVIVISAYFTEDILFQLIDCHIFTAVKKTTEYEWLEQVAKAVNQ